MSKQVNREKPIASPWSKSVEDVLSKLDVSQKSGLNDAQVKERMKKFGANRLREMETLSSWDVFLNQFKSIIIIILIAAGILSFAFGEFIDGFAISAAVIINAIIGFVMELKAIRSMESLRQMEKVTAKVLRNGKMFEKPADELVPGDLVIVEGGDIVSADIRLVESAKLRADESTLTGESVPSGKTIEPVDSNAQIADRSNMLFKGTSITGGSGMGVVAATGMDTELGRISELIQQAEDEQTPLEKRLEKLGQKLLWLVFGILIVVASLGIWRGKEALLMIETAVALAVAAVPEGLPIVATIAMARGMLRMAKRNALVKRLAVVETLGGTNVICTDKTGTLTENKMTVSEIIIEPARIKVKDNSSNEPFTKESGESPENQESEILKELLEAGVLCNNASLTSDEKGDSSSIGDPLEAALLEVGVKGGIDRDTMFENHPEHREEAFDPAVKMMATFNKDRQGYRVSVKGAPEIVLKHCSTIRASQGIRDITNSDIEYWSEENRRLAKQGLRVLAVAAKRSETTDIEPYDQLTFTGLIVMVDPPRKDVSESIDRCRQAGIRVVMVTGDQADTASSIAESIRLTGGEKFRTIEGKDIKPSKQLTDEQKKSYAATAVFARVSPEQKLDLIDIHRQAGSVVGMTGDGVNDAPALKKADIGIAMGQRGTQVAREAADMILKDDAFSSIVVAVEEGRIIFDNIRKFVLYLLSGNVSEIMVVFIASLFNYPLPILPLQILFLNIVSDVFPALALGVGAGSSDIMNRPPRDPSEPVITRQGWSAIFGYGGLIMLPVFASFIFAQKWLDMSDTDAVTVSFLTLAFARLWHIFNMRDTGTEFIKNEITTNKYVWAAIVFCTGLLIGSVYLPGLSEILTLSGPGVNAWITVIVFSLFPWLVGQLIKQFRS
jgi:Ca2+-transporting ATPase